MTRSRRPYLVRLVPLLCLVALAWGSSAGTRPAVAATRGFVAFTFAPQRAYQDADAAVAVSVRPLGARCSLSVRYADGSRQRGLEPVRAASGTASWKWHVPTSAGAAGPARVTASCGRAGHASRTIVVVGSVVPLRIDVVKQGFSIRPQPYGSGENVSYGLILRNGSAKSDAKDVTVLVNFVGPDNVLYGSATTLVPEISRGSTYALGGQLVFPGAAPVVRLEATVQVSARTSGAAPHPTLANLRVVPSIFEPAWIGGVEGEMVNDQPSFLLQRAQLSAVVFDAAGNVIGGGTGYAFASLPPGGREFIQIQTGMNAIPFAKAAMVEVSVLATYQRL